MKYNFPLCIEFISFHADSKAGTPDPRRFHYCNSSAQVHGVSLKKKKNTALFSGNALYRTLVTCINVSISPSLVFDEWAKSSASSLLALKLHRLGGCIREPLAEELPLLDIARRTVSNENIWAPVYARALRRWKGARCKKRLLREVRASFRALSQRRHCMRYIISRSSYRWPEFIQRVEVLAGTFDEWDTFCTFGGCPLWILHGSFANLAEARDPTIKKIFDARSFELNLIEWPQNFVGNRVSRALVEFMLRISNLDQG